MTHVVADAHPAEAPAGPRNVYVSALELFSIGIGPSSSHTVGPMRAGFHFARQVLDAGAPVVRVTATLYGSLAATGLGHGTPDALVAGLTGLQPHSCDPDDVHGAWSGHVDDEPLLLGGVLPVPFRRDDLDFEPRLRKPGHPNALTLRAWSSPHHVALRRTYYSVGGGFIRIDGEPPATHTDPGGPRFATMAELLRLTSPTRSIADVAWDCELARHDATEVEQGLDAIWAAMRACVDAGLAAEGTLPGGLRVKRRAAGIRRALEDAERAGRDVSSDWLYAYALAVNEENAAGRRVVTAPTNGAAGIVPAVLHHYWHSTPGASSRDVRTFLLTATAVGSLIKANASISGAEGGCQAEVGSACAMSAAGLCALHGGSPAQVENAAEIAMEHHLGLTCDPVGGLVQIPCIERNAIAATAAIAAAGLALYGDGSHRVPLDTVIETMRQTGADMSLKYKETSTGGLAVNVVEC